MSSRQSFKQDESRRKQVTIPARGTAELMEFIREDYQDHAYFVTGESFHIADKQQCLQAQSICLELSLLQ